MMTTSMLLLRNLSTPTVLDPVSAEGDSFALANERPPAGYAIALLADGRFLPLTLMPLGEEALTFALCQCGWQTDPIPLAEGEYSSPGHIICASYQEALWQCERHYETACLLREIGAATLSSECYPERNVWYREETERLLRQAGYEWPAWPESRDGDEDEKKRETESKGPFCIVEALDGCPRLLAWLELRRASGYPRCSISNLHVEAANLDELWERLYDAVRTVLAWQRKETDDEAFPITKAAS
jgi:hypothetical protein